MFKKEYLFVFVILGLGIAYGVLSLIVFITRGKWFRVLNKRIALGTMVVTFIAMLSSGSIAYSQEDPTPTPTPTPAYGTPPVVTPSVPPPTIAPYAVTAPTTPDPTAKPTPTIAPYAITAPTTPEPTAEPTPPIVPLYGVPEMGDVNWDSKVTIIDSLLISQYYVGLNPPNFFEGAANVDCSDRIDIIDALLVSQKYVGLIDEFTCDE